MNDKKEPTTKTNVNELIKKEEEKNKGPATSVLEIIDRLSDNGQFAFYNVVDQEDESGKTTHVYYPVGEPLDETPNKIFAIGSRNDGFATADIIPDANEDLRNIDQLNERIEKQKKAAAARDNSGDQITDARQISEYRKDGYHVVTNKEIESGKYQKPEYAEKIVKSTVNIQHNGVNTFEIEYRNGEKIVMTARQSDVYIKFRELYLTPGLFNYNDLRRMLDVINLTLDNSAAELMQLFNRYATPGANQDELNTILNQIETLTGIKITGVNNGSVDFNITAPARTAQGLYKYPSHEFLTTALTAANLAHNYTQKMTAADVDSKTKQINELLARRSNRTTTAQVAVDKSIAENGLTVVDITRSTMIIKHQTKTKETVIEIPFTKALISKHSNYYAIWFELVGMITRDINFNAENKNAEVGEIAVPYKYFSEIKLYSRTSDAKSAIYKNDDFTAFINNISGRIKQLKPSKRRNAEPLKRANAMFTNIDFYDNYFTVQYSKRFNWNILYEYFAPFPENWQELNPETKSLLIVILMHWRRAVGGTYFNYFDDKYNDPAEILKEVPTTIKLLNRTIQQQCIGRSEDSTSNPTLYIKKPIVEIVGKLNKWFEETQPETMQLKIKFEKPTGYGSIDEFLDDNGVVVTFGSAYLDYGAEILTKQRDNAQEQNRIKKEKEKAAKKEKNRRLINQKLTVSEP